MKTLVGEEFEKSTLQRYETCLMFREMLISQKDLLLKFEQIEKLVVQHDDDIQAIFRL